MDFEHSAQSRGERLISSLRSLAALGLLALLRLDPALRSRHGQDTLWLLGVYALYALLLAALFWAYDRIELRSRLAVHVLDLAVFAVLCWLVEGAAAVSLVFFSFLLLAGASRWRWRGALGTALAGIAIYLGVGLGLGVGLSSGWLARGASLGLLAALFTAVSAYQQRLSREMLKIAAWPRGPLQDADALLAHLLARVAGILEAPRVLLAWEEADEPWLYLAQWSGAGIERFREAPLEAPLVPSPLSEASFLSKGAGETWYSTAGGVERWHGEPGGPRSRSRRPCAAASPSSGWPPGRCAARPSRVACSPSTAATSSGTTWCWARSRPSASPPSSTSSTSPGNCGPPR